MTKNYNKDYDELLKVPPIRLKTHPVKILSETTNYENKITNLEKKVENLEKMLYNLKSVVDKQLKIIKVLKNNQNQEKANGYNNRS